MHLLSAVDVHYATDSARAACVQFEAWSSAAPRHEQVVTIADVEPYVPGELFKRELPPIVRVLGALAVPPSLVIVDGYVWLDTAFRRGLGARLHEAIGAHIPVVGVAKTAFRGDTGAFALVRGAGARPLFVSAIGIALEEAVNGVRAMHGAHRIPTLLQRVDHLSRGIPDALAIGEYFTHG